MLSAPRRELERVDLAAERGLPLSLVAAIEADGGLWHAGDHYTDAAAVVARAREVKAVALRLDFRAVQGGDLSPLETIPSLVAVGRGSRFVGEPPYPDLVAMSSDHPLREEFRRAVSG